MDDDIEHIRAQQGGKGMKFNARAVWNLYLADSHAPLISHAAVAILSVCASEAAVERTFSAQGLVHSDLRNRMSSDTVEAEMFIKFNARTVQKVEDRKVGRSKPVSEGHTVEMAEDDDDEDVEIPSMAGVFRRMEEQEAEEEGEEKAEEQVEQKEERKEPGAEVVIHHVRAAPPEDEVQAFIQYFVQKYEVNAQMKRWKGDMCNNLVTEGQEWKPPMQDTEVVLKRKVMAYVRALDEREEEVEVVAVDAAAIT